MAILMVCGIPKDHSPHTDMYYIWDIKVSRAGQGKKCLESLCRLQHGWDLRTC